MPTVNSFADSSVVSLAYAINAGVTAGDLAGVDFDYIPYQTEGFKMNKVNVKSTAITDDRRPRNSKNTRGQANGAVTMEFGGITFIHDMLSLLLMADWADVNSAAPGFAGDGMFLIDSDVKKYAAIEKTVKSGPLTTDMLYHERFYGSAVNDGTIALGGDLITLALNYISAFADFSEAQAGVGGLGGSMANSKTAPAAYEVADGPNNLTTVTLKDALAATMPVTFSDLNLKVENNVRTQDAVNSSFAAGIGIGKVGVMLDGEMYFYDQEILQTHMTNARMSAEFAIATSEGTFNIYLPRLAANTPESNSTGENQDYKTRLSFTAEKGTVTQATYGAGGDAGDQDCLILVKYTDA